MTVAIQVEHAPLGSRALLYQDQGQHIRAAYDPDHLVEDEALALLYVQLPRLVTATVDVQRCGAPMA
ncbi:hypothetical protein ACGFX7_06490 [Streptomyces harbinensis]|uniref:hypothetical protein n=1 Tax=Streptomyces harbinensis TaxID=1176198 RepID=UPI0037205BBB